LALRISSPGSTPEQPERRAERLVARAQASLLARDHAGYRALFDETAAIEDVHRRYQARKQLLEEGLAAAGRAQRKDVPQTYLTVARAAVKLVDDEPREPYFLNYLGVALYELGQLDVAEALFRAALRLDETVPHAESNLGQIARRRRSGSAVVISPAVKAALQPVLPRAREAARKARRVEGHTLSLCMIVKDEEEMLPQMLEAVKPAVDEMIVVDTGSTDRTVEIAESFGATVLHHEWTGDFAAARNVSIDAATGDWILWLDADEVLVADDAKELRKLTGQVWREAFYLVEKNFTGDVEDGTAVTHNALRVFRNRPEYRFNGRLHEQFAHNLPGYLGERVAHTHVRIEHYGYLGVVRDKKDKARRNLELLEKQSAEGLDTSYHKFNLGSEFLALGEWQKAADLLVRSWSEMEDDPRRHNYPYMPSLASRVVIALREAGRLDDAHAQAEAGLEVFPGFTDLVFHQANIAKERGDLAESRRLYERCLEMGDAPARYTATVGCGSYLALMALAAMADSARQQELLTRCLDEHPAFYGPVLPLATAMLNGGDAPADVVAAIESRVAKPTATVHFMLGTALYEAGAAEEAEAQFRSVLDGQPDQSHARVALAEAVLSQGRFDDAAAIAAGVPDGDPCAGAARRSQLFALLVAGAADTARDVLVAASADLPPADAGLFSAWLDAASGRPLPAVLPRDAQPLLTATLEALLRVREVDAFGQLVPLVDRVGMAARERRELLASMYLRRGFLESAADEWIGVVQELGPDARALTGLALVAAAKELPDDALEFARGARELDPGHEAAQLLVRNLELAAA
jgi:glycosyltransferase involved in cell wall biosynthesis/Flp pilus assembly protein TadD